jgi:hypothetical protein
MRELCALDRFDFGLKSSFLFFFAEWRCRISSGLLSSACYQISIKKDNELH